jgi:hypothetical protein
LRDGALPTVRDSIEIDAELAKALRSARAAADVYRRLLALRDQAQRDGFCSIRWASELGCARAAATAGDHGRARDHLKACMQRPSTEVALDCPSGHWWHGLWRLAQQLHAPEYADVARAEGVAWIHRTLQNELPPEFHASFRNAVADHRELLAG